MKNRFDRSYVIFSLKMGVACLCLWYLLSSGILDIEQIASIFSPPKLLLVIGAAFFFFCSQALAAFRLNILLKTAKVHLHFKACFSLTMFGSFANTLLPGAIGGDVVKGIILVQKEDKRGNSSGRLLMDRIIGLFAVVFIVGISCVCLLWQYNIPTGFYRNIIVGLMFFVAFIFFLFFAGLIISKKQPLRNKLRIFLSDKWGNGFFYNVTKGFGDVVMESKNILAAFAISIAIHILSLFGLLFIAKTTPAVVDGVILMMMASIVIFLGIIPVSPGNVGWTEMIATFCWSAIGSSEGALIFFCWRIITILCSLPWGVVYFFRHIIMKGVRK